MTQLCSAFVCACICCFLRATIATQRHVLYTVHDAYAMEGPMDSQLKSENRGQISLTLSTTELSQPDAEWVRLTWSGVPRPEKYDVLALYAIEEPSWWKKAPIKTTYATVDPGYLSRGAGTLNVRLLNHRQNVQFMFLRSVFGWHRIVAKSPVITVKHKDAPTGIHLALTKKSNEMSVQWVSGSSVQSWVQWGLAPGDLTENAPSIVTTYKADDLCGPPATEKGYIFPGYMHNGVITGLIPNTWYYYQVGNEDGGYSKEFSFKAPPKIGDKTTVKIIGIADMGQYNEDLMGDTHGRLPSLETSENINAESEVDLITHMGDISYAQGYVADWDVFFEQLLPVTAQVPYMTILGNHERLYEGSGDRYGDRHDSGGECGVVYERRLQMPTQGPDRPWYSFDFASIHFTMISIEHPFEQGTEQYKFLEEDLKSVDRGVTPWLVVGQHRPMYPGITMDRPPAGYWFVAQELQEQLGDLFKEYKVDMVWSGHHHSYQRTCPVHKETCVPVDAQTGEATAPVQIIFGNAGAHLYTNLVPRSFIEYQECFYGYVRIHANATQMKVESVRNSDRKVVDSTILYKRSPT